MLENHFLEQKVRNSDFLGLKTSGFGFKTQIFGLKTLISAFFKHISGYTPKYLKLNLKNHP